MPSLETSFSHHSPLRGLVALISSCFASRSVEASSSSKSTNCSLSYTMIRAAAVAALCFGSSSAFVAVQPARVSSVAVQAVPRDDAAKPLAALAPAAQLAGALTLATITIGAPEVACARSVSKL